MGIYYDGNVYGVSWILYDEYYKNILIQYEKKFTEKINIDDSDSEVIITQKRLQIKEIKDEFDKLSEEQLSECIFSIYTYATDTYSDKTESYMMLAPVSIESLKIFFEKGDVLV